MRELERDLFPTSARLSALPRRVAIVGAGRVGSALAEGLSDAGIAVDGPLGHGATAAGADAVLLCVPDREIAAAAASVAPGPAVGHCSGTTGLEVLAPHEAFSLHPLMAITRGFRPHRLAGAGAAIDATTPRAREVAVALAEALGLQPLVIAADDRAVYHAAASMASNFLVTLEAAAEELAGAAGVDRAQLVPLVRATVDNWARLGPQGALTGPVARGDEATVARQREAVAERAPHLVALFDALVEATRELAARGAALA